MTRAIVVLVEDDPLNRLLGIDALERAGFEVADFARADEASSYMERMSDDVVGLLADINVPGERDGIDLAQVFAERWPDKAVVLTSGRFGGQGPSDLPLDVAFIPKPWTARALMDCVARVFRPGA